MVQDNSACVVESELCEDVALDESSSGPASVHLTDTEGDLCKLYKQLDDKVSIDWAHNAVW